MTPNVGNGAHMKRVVSGMQGCGYELRSPLGRLMLGIQSAVAPLQVVSVLSSALLRIDSIAPLTSFTHSA